MSTHLSHALLAYRDRRDLTVTAIAAQIGISQGALSHLIADGRRPDALTLRALATKVEDSRDGLEMLLAHLRDEVDRAGRNQTEVTIAADQRDAGSDIRLLEEQSRTDTELRAIIHDLARLVRSIRRKYPEPLASNPLAAEDAPAETPLAQVTDQETVRREVRKRHSSNSSSSSSASA